MNDNKVRVLIAEMRAKHSGRDGNPDAYQLALIAQELMAQRDARSEDFYSSNRAIHALEERVAELEAQLGSGEVDEDGDAG